MKFTLPACVRPSRIGHWSYGSESEYDASGELAPITWTCNCGSWIKTELLNRETDQYEQVSDEDKARFLAEHQDCKPLCYNCRKVEVAEHNYWCEECDK